MIAEAAVPQFVQNAQRILDTAQSAIQNGEYCTDTTILMGLEGGIRVITESDWPLDSLVLHHGAQSAYRVCERKGAIHVEAREGARSCVLESKAPMRAWRFLPGA